MGYIPSHIRAESEWRANVRRSRANAAPLVLIGLAIGGAIAVLATVPLPI